MKFFSWNVCNKTLDKVIEPILRSNADIIALQKIKPAAKVMSDEAYKTLSNYLQIWDNIGSGMAIFSRIRDIKMIRIDFDGCVISIWFDNFCFLNIYAPPLAYFGKEDYLNWYKDFDIAVKELMQVRPVVLCGDFSIRSNFDNISPEEETALDDLLNSGLIDTFNKLYPNKSDAFNARGRSKEFDRRQDYFFVSKSLQGNIIDTSIIIDDLGINHRPITLDIDI